MGLRKDFSVHKRKTIESFELVKADISGISLEIESLKNIIASFGSRISAIDNELLNLSRNASSNNLSISSKIDRRSSSMSDAIAAVNTLRNGINIISSNYQRMSKNMSGNKNSIKKLELKSKAESLRAGKLGYSLKKSQKETKKLKNILKISSRRAKSADSGLVKRIVSQQKRIVQLNRKIEGKKDIRKSVSRKKIRRKATPRKIITRKITPKKKVTTIKTPRRTITRTETPKKKEIVEIFRQKKPLI